MALRTIFLNLMILSPEKNSNHAILREKVGILSLEIYLQVMKNVELILVDSIYVLLKKFMNCLDL